MKVLANKEFGDVIGWLPSGKAFVVHKPKVFASTIMPEHFKSAKYSSFTRKLHRWGFARQYRGEETGAFFHVDFQRDRLDLVEKMACNKQESGKMIKAEGAPKPFKKPSMDVTFSKKFRGIATPTVAVAKPTPRFAFQRAELPAVDFLDGKTGISGSRSMDRCPNDGQGLPVSDSEVLLALQRRSMMMNANTDWNVAIELEVSRRLKQRMNAAATFGNRPMWPQTAQVEAVRASLRPSAFSCSQLSAFDSDYQSDLGSGGHVASLLEKTHGMRFSPVAQSQWHLGTTASTNAAVPSATQVYQRALAAAAAASKSRPNILGSKTA
jgi:HSF-type DNA-binding